MKGKMFKITISLAVGILLLNSWILFKYKEEVERSFFVKDAVQPMKQDVKKAIETEGVVIPEYSFDVRYDEKKGERYTLKVEHGERVQEGDILLQYENSSLTAEIESLEKKKEDVEEVLAKVEEELADLESVPVNTYSSEEEEKMTAFIQSVEANQVVIQKSFERQQLSQQLIDVNEQLEKLKQLEGELSITSPRSGVVTVENEQVENDGETILSIRAEGPFMMKGLVSEYEVANLETGMKAFASIHALNGEKIEGVMKEISRTPVNEPSLKKQESHYPIYIELIEENDRVFEGFHATLELVLIEKNDVLTLPERAIMQKGNKKYVYVLEEGLLKRQKVKTGLTKGHFVEVVNGVKKGDQVVLNPTKSLEHGKPFYMPVKVKHINRDLLDPFNREEMLRLFVKGMFRS